MTEATDLHSTSDERMLAALAHFFGAIAALIVWAMQKDKSRFVRFQAVQALAFDFAVMLLMGVIVFCLIGVMSIGMFGGIFAVVKNSSPPEYFSMVMALAFMFPFLMSVCILPFSLAILIARIIATVSVVSGNDFQYPFLGAKVQAFLAD